MAEQISNVHWHMGRLYKEVPARNGCQGCDLKPPLGQTCYVNIWYDHREVKVVCGMKPVIFKEVTEDDSL